MHECDCLAQLLLVVSISTLLKCLQLQPVAASEDETAFLHDLIIRFVEEESAKP